MASFRSLRWWVTARRHPSALLLAVQLAGVLLYPVMEETVRGRTLFGAFQQPEFVRHAGVDQHQCRSEQGHDAQSPASGDQQAQH